MRVHQTQITIDYIHLQKFLQQDTYCVSSISFTIVDLLYIYRYDSMKTQCMLFLSIEELVYPNANKEFNFDYENKHICTFTKQREKSSLKGGFEYGYFVSLKEGERY